MIIIFNFDFNFDGMPLYARNLSFAQRMNLLLNGLNGALRKNSNFGLPPIIQVEPSTFCNLHCPLCPSHWLFPGALSDLTGRALPEKAISKGRRGEFP